MGEPRRRSTLSPWRVGVAALVLLAGFALIVARLVEVQLLRADEYAATGQQQRVVTVELAAPRGDVLDRDGAVLATSVPAYAVVVDPQALRAARDAPGGDDVPSAGEAADLLAGVLDSDPGDVADELDAGGRFRYLARQQHPEVADAVEELALPGVEAQREPRRVYPNGPLAGHLLGHTDIDGEGIAGVELWFDEQLTGTPGQRQYERDPFGVPIASADRRRVPPEPGRDLRLTIDRDVQHLAERALGDAVDDAEAAAGSALVLDVDDGEILAAAEYPPADPGAPDTTPSGQHRLRSVVDAFEPGSTQKPLTLASVIDHGAASLTTSIDVPDRVRVADSTFTDTSPVGGPADVAEILARSSNVGVITLAQRLEEAQLHDTLRRFGVGEPTGVQFPGESAGALRHHDNWWATSLPTIAIGHGVSSTLLQTADAYATIARGGERLTPTVVADDDREARRVVSEDAADQVRRALVEVVEAEHGTGAEAAVDGVAVAGKTGTARRVEGGGYTDEHIASFVGFAPADDPEIVVAVSVDRPRTSIYASQVAAPAFADIVAGALSATAR